MSRVSTPREWPDVTLRPVHGDRWGDWVFDENWLTLAHYDPADGLFNSEIDLERCTDSKRVLNYIFRAAQRGHDVSTLVDAIADLLPFAHSSMFGIDCAPSSAFNPTKWLKRPRQPKDVSKAEFDAAWKKFKDAQRIQQNLDRVIETISAHDIQQKLCDKITRYMQNRHARFIKNNIYKPGYSADVVARGRLQTLCQSCGANAEIFKSVLAKLVNTGVLETSHWPGSRQTYYSLVEQTAPAQIAAKEGAANG